MPTIYLHHDKHFDLVLDESGDEKALADLSKEDAAVAKQEDKVLTGGTVYDSEGVYTVNGDQTRHKIAVEQPGNHTTILVPDDYVASPIALTHLVETLTDRNAHPDAITGVSGDNPRLVQRLAALMGVDVVEAPVAEEASQ